MLKRTLNSSIYILVLLFSLNLEAQQFSLESGQIISSFDFKDSQGNQKQYLKDKMNHHLNISYSTKLYKDWVYLNFGSSISGYSAIGSDNKTHSYMSWETTYLGTSIGIETKLFCYKEAQLFINGLFSTEFLLNGNQTLDNRVYDLKKIEAFANTAYFVKGGFYINYPVSDNTKLLFKYQMGKSSNLENNGQELHINIHQVSIGLQINFKIKKQEK